MSEDSFKTTTSKTPKYRPHPVAKSVPCPVDIFHRLARNRQHTTNTPSPVNLPISGAFARQKILKSLGSFLDIAVLYLIDRCTASSSHQKRKAFSGLPMMPLKARIFRDHAEDKSWVPTWNGLPAVTTKVHNISLWYALSG